MHGVFVRTDIGIGVAWGSVEIRIGGNMVERQSAELENILIEAEEKFKKAVTTLNQWGDQARMVIQTRPAAVLAGAAVLGFITGLLLRRDRHN